MKKAVAMLLCIIAIFAAFPAAAHADVGPKPSVTIDFEGLEGRRYYVTLLSSYPTTGPFSALEEGEEAYSRYQVGDADYDIFRKFVQYEDADGFYFLQYFEDCTQSHRFSWTYYPPEEFKVLLYFPDTDSFLTDNTRYRRYAFDSYFTAAVQADGALSIVKSYDYTGEAISLAVRIVLTIAIELAVALLFGLREKGRLRFIAMINLLTQIGLNVTLSIVNYHMGLFGFLAIYILLEMAVFALEGALYAAFLPKRGEKKLPCWLAWAYALAANSLSFLLGLFLAVWLPGAF